MEKELSWVNWLKSICMILVFLNHSEIYGAYNLTSIRNFYLPIFVNAFFFVSGYLLFRKQLYSPTIDIPFQKFISGEARKVFTGIVYRIIIPSIVFSFILYFPKKLLRGEEVEVHTFICDTILGGSLWFTSALAIAELGILFMLFFRIRTIWYYVTLCSITAWGGYLLFKSGICIWDNFRIPWHYKSGMSAMFIMSVGGLYCMYEDSIDHYLLNRKVLILLIVIAYTIFCIFGFNFFCGGLDVAPFNIISIPPILVGSLMMVLACKRLPDNSFINTMGRHTIGLYFLCGAMPNFFAVILSNFIEPSAISTIIIWVLSFCSAFLIEKFLSMNKYSKWLFDLRVISVKS